MEEDKDLEKPNNFEEKLIETDPYVFEGISDEKKQQIIKSFVVTMKKSHSGPLPDTETLSDIY